MGERMVTNFSKGWHHQIQTTGVEEIREYCVKDQEWQRFRISLKGKSTETKLEMLEARRYSLLDDDGILSRRHQVQFDNYINALKRGGQLHVDGTIKS